MNKDNEFSDFKKGNKYKIYIGLKDKSCDEQLIKTSEAMKLVGDICKKYFTGFTMYYCNGYYKGKLDQNSTENTILVELINPLEDCINSFCLDLKKLLRQSSILIEAESIHYRLFK